MKKLFRVAAVAVTGLGFAAPGLAAAQTGTISTTGPSSYNEVRHHDDETTRLDNHNRLNVNNNNPQSAYTGYTTASNNTTVGDVSTGDAMNDSLTRASVTLRNSSAATTGSASSDMGAAGTISNTGPNSTNTVEHVSTVDWRATNTNDLNINNTNSQIATSGSASVTNNTTAGNVTSGDASNVSTNEFVLNVTNE